MLPSHRVLNVELTPPPPNNEPGKTLGAHRPMASWPQPPLRCHGHQVSQGLAHGRGAPSCALEGTTPEDAETCSHPSCSSTPFPSTPRSHQSLVMQLVPISLLSSRSVTLSPHLPSQLSPLVCPLSAFFALLFQPFPISCQPASGPQTSG